MQSLLRDAGDRVLEERLHKKTKDGYDSKMKYIMNFMKNHPVHCAWYNDRDGEMILLLPFKAVKDLFSALATDTDLPRLTKAEREVLAARRERRQRVRRVLDGDDSGNDSDSDEEEDMVDPLKHKRTISKSCMQGYKSALKNYHAKHGKRFEAYDEVPSGKTLDAWCDEFIKGYARIVAQKKQEGIMKVGEGKAELPFGGYRALNERFIRHKPPPRYEGL